MTREPAERDVRSGRGAAAYSRGVSPTTTVQLTPLAGDPSVVSMPVIEPEIGPVAPTASWVRYATCCAVQSHPRSPWSPRVVSGVNWEGGLDEVILPAPLETDQSGP